MKSIAPYLALAVFAAACASHEAKTPVVDRSTGAPGTAPSTASSAATPAATSSIAGNPLTDPSSVLSKRTVYFDFDSSEVKDEYRPLIQAHARYLTGHRDAYISIDGNCDERGSREYNLALGQRRAEAVKKIMTVLGVADSRIEAISFGKEKPVALGHDDESWQKNRRDDIKYPGE